MKNLSDRELREVAKLKGESDETIARKVHLGLLAAKFVWAILAAIAVGSVTGTVWVYGLQTQVRLNSNYIEEERSERVQERLHDAEMAGQRRDKQIDQLNRKVFQYEP